MRSHCQVVVFHKRMVLSAAIQTTRKDIRIYRTLTNSRKKTKQPDLATKRPSRREKAKNTHRGRMPEYGRRNKKTLQRLSGPARSVGATFSQNNEEVRKSENSVVAYRRMPKQRKKKRQNAEGGPEREKEKSKGNTTLQILGAPSLFRRSAEQKDQPTRQQRGLWHTGRGQILAIRTKFQGGHRTSMAFQLPAGFELWACLGHLRYQVVEMWKISKTLVSPRETRVTTSISGVR